MHFNSCHRLRAVVLPLFLWCGCAVAYQHPSPPQSINDHHAYLINQGAVPNLNYGPTNSYAQPQPLSPQSQPLPPHQSGPTGYAPQPNPFQPSVPNLYSVNNNQYNNAPQPLQPPPQLPQQSPQQPPQNNYGSNYGNNNYPPQPPNNNYGPPVQQPGNSYGPPPPPSNNNNPSPSNYGNVPQPNPPLLPPPQPQQSYSQGSSYNRPNQSNQPTYNANKGYYNAPKPYSYQYNNNTSAYEGSVAEAILRGYSYTLNENNNKAVVKLFQDRNLGLNINMLLCNLSTNTYYSFYVHQYGELNNGCDSAGPQYTSVPISTHPLTGLQTHPTGFIGFIKTNNESQIFQTNTKELNLDEIIGRSIVIHELAVNASALPTSLNNQMLNNLSLFLNPGSNPFIVGNRLACGVVGRANPLTFNRAANMNCEIELPTENRDIVSFNRVVPGNNNNNAGSSGSSTTAQPVKFPN